MGLTNELQRIQWTPIGCIILSDPICLFLASFWIIFLTLRGLARLQVIVIHYPSVQEGLIGNSKSSDDIWN